MGWLYLLGEIVGSFGGVEFVTEGWEATQADVQDNPEGPNVDCAVVGSVFRVS